MNDATKVAVIADDDEYFRIALTSILEKLEFTQVIETTSLDNAIEALSSRKGEVTLALFDLDMPGMLSAASLKAVKDFDSNLKIAVVSGSTRRSDILTALQTGVNGYVPKGLGATELMAALGQILDGAVFVPPTITETSEAEPDGAMDGVGEQIDADSVQKLTPRQRDVLRMLVAGKTTKEIAADLGLSSGTVKIHLKALFKTLRVKNRAAAAVAGTRIMSSGMLG